MEVPKIIDESLVFANQNWGGILQLPKGWAYVERLWKRPNCGPNSHPNRNPRVWALVVDLL